jgi:hypothetical protein
MAVTVVTSVVEQVEMILTTVAQPATKTFAPGVHPHLLDPCLLLRTPLVKMLVPLPLLVLDLVLVAMP